ncbi:MAG: hypothetical protein WD402_10285 [Chloroflexota bacterium]
MTTPLQIPSFEPAPAASTTPSRRALLAGALGALGAMAASAIGRPRTARAADPNDVLLGGPNAAISTTSITNSSNGDTVFSATSSSTGVGVAGISTGGNGIFGQSDASIAIVGNAGQGIAVFGNSNGAEAISGQTDASDHPAILGRSSATANSTGVQGFSGDTPPPPKAKTGVYGYAAQDGSSKGVYGESPNGYAGYFSGKVYTTKFYELAEISAPVAPLANRARLFARDNGAGKTQLCVRFNTGAVQVIATQP